MHNTGIKIGSEYYYLIFQPQWIVKYGVQQPLLNHSGNLLINENIQWDFFKSTNI